MKSYTLLLLMSLLFLFACKENEISNTCNLIDCIENAYCDEEQQACVCIDGWEMVDGVCQEE